MRGKEAQMVLDNEAFKSAMEIFHKGFQEAILKVPDERKYDDDLRRAQMMLKMARMFESILVGMVQKGNYAQHQVDLKKLRDEPPARVFFKKIIG